MRGGWQNHYRGVLKICGGDPEEARKYIANEQRGKQLLSTCSKMRKRSRTK